MKNLIILLLTAAAVGVLITRVMESPADGGEPADGPMAEASAPVPPPEPAAQAVEPEPEPTASILPEPVELPGGLTAPPEPALLAERAGEPEESEPPADTRLRDGRRLLEEGERIKARRVLTEVYLDSEGPERREAHNLLRQINEELVFNPRVRAGATIHRVQPGETLTRIGRRYGVNWRGIARLSGMEPDGMLRVGQELKLLIGQPRVIVWKSDFRLALFLDDVFIKEYEVGIGKDGATPTGEFEVDSMLIQPRWYAPDGRVVEYGDEDHLLGERWIGFKNQPGASGLGIHGTRGSYGIGQEMSMGCIRMRNEDVIELYDFLMPATRVLIKE